MYNEKTFEPGDKVTYVPSYEHAPYQKGVVKSVHEDGKHCFVVYNCGGDWENYQDYTAAKTANKYLTKGWIND